MLSDHITSAGQDTIASVVPDSIVKTDTATRKSAKPFRFPDNEPALASETNSDSAIAAPVVKQSPAIFKNHVLKRTHESAQPLNTFTADWFSGVLITLVVLFTWFRYFYFRIFHQLIDSYFNITATNQIVRDESVLLQRASLIISVFSYLLAGLFLYQLSVYYQWSVPFFQPGIIRFAMFSLLIALAYSVKMVLLRLLSFVFYHEKAAALYIFNIFLMVFYGGIILLPSVVLIAYADPGFRGGIITVVVVLLGVLFVYRLVRGIMIWANTPAFPIFYLFLYLCTFEIAPLLIIWKICQLEGVG